MAYVDYSGEGTGAPPSGFADTFWNAAAADPVGFGGAPRAANIPAFNDWKGSYMGEESPASAYANTFYQFPKRSHGTLESIFRAAPLIIPAIFSAGYGGFLGGTGAGAGSATAGAGATAGMSAADVAGLVQMGEAAGLSGSALETFVASGGTFGSAAGAAGAGAPIGFGPPGPRGEQFAAFPEWAGRAESFYPGAASSGAGGFQGLFDSSGLGDFQRLSSLASEFAPGETGGIPDVIRRTGSIFGGGPVSLGVNAFSGLLGLKKERDYRKMAERAAQMNDPFGPHRAGYANDLRALMSDPSKITSMPGYRAGLDAVERKMASQGYIGSGNMMAALQKYGGDFFNAETARLANLAGAQFAPGGGSLLMEGQRGSADLFRRALESLNYSTRGFETIYGRR